MALTEDIRTGSNSTSLCFLTGSSEPTSDESSSDPGDDRFDISLKNWDGLITMKFKKILKVKK